MKDIRTLTRRNVGAQYSNMFTPNLITRNEIAPSKELKIVWNDDLESIYNFRELRYSCQCALCKHEITGEKLIQFDSIPEDINLTTVEQVGNYAIHIIWSDGHSTGFFSYDYLRKLTISN